MDMLEKIKIRRLNPNHNNPEILKASIISNISNILNTRSSSSLSQFFDPKTKLDNLNFGLPDFTHLSPQSPRDIKKLSEAIKKALEVFEPRISQINVSFSHKQEQHIFFSLECCLNNLGQSFLIQLDLKRWSLQISED